MPGVLILESMAQTAACLVSYQDKSLSSNNLVFFTGMKKLNLENQLFQAMIDFKNKSYFKKRSLYKFNGEALFKIN